jgi:hypothetical protein
MIGIAAKVLRFEKRARLPEQIEHQRRKRQHAIRGLAQLHGLRLCICNESVEYGRRHGRGRQFERAKTTRSAVRRTCICPAITRTVPLSTGKSIESLHARLQRLKVGAAPPKAGQRSIDGRRLGVETMLRILGRLILLAACTLLLAGFSQAAAQQQPLTFGVAPQRSAALTARYWNPILNYVGTRSGVPLILKLAKTPAEHTEMLRRWQFDFTYSTRHLLPNNNAAGYRVFARPIEAEVTAEIDFQTTVLHDP